MFVAQHGRVNPRRKISQRVACDGGYALWARHAHGRHSSSGCRTPKALAAQTAGFYRAELGQQASNRQRALPQTPHPRSNLRWNARILSYAQVNKRRGRSLGRAVSFPGTDEGKNEIRKC
jgi:hypothetical protein